MKKKKIVFMTGTRADFGKLKPLIAEINGAKNFQAHIFATGMHMLEKYGSTVHEIFRQGFSNIYMYNNSALAHGMDIALSNTIYGFSNYIRELKPDMIIVHGDRPEALAGAIVGAFNNILVGHIEGGEISGTIDELVRHSITKLAHLHFVSNKDSEKRLMQMGESQESIFKIGSPEVDLMVSKNLPPLSEVKANYEIDFDEYAILIYHPVTTEIDALPHHIQQVVEAIIESQMNYIVVTPNNDAGADIIVRAYKKFNKYKRIKLYPSLRFEYYLVLLKGSSFIIGNSSSGVREASTYGIPAINIGSRQNNRNEHPSIFNIPEDKSKILGCIKNITKKKIRFNAKPIFGDGKSAERFLSVLQSNLPWSLPLQKQFITLKLP